MSRWYIIHAYSGFENKVKDSILAEATRLGNKSAEKMSSRGTADQEDPAPDTSEDSDSDDGWFSWLGL